MGILNDLQGSLRASGLKGRAIGRRHKQNRSKRNRLDRHRRLYGGGAHGQVHSGEALCMLCSAGARGSGSFR